MNTNEMIAVVIPTYNRAKTITKCLQSICNQTYKNLEIIVVDDCSSDNTEEVVKGIQDGRIRYYRLSENRRACFARNYGMERAKGSYIAFQDSDDIWKPDKLEKQYDYLIKSGCDFVFCGMDKIDENGKFVSVFPEVDMRNVKDFYLQELKLNVISTQTILMKKCVGDSVKFDVSFRKYQDWDFAIRVAQKYKIAYLNQQLVEYYIQNDSISITVSHYDALMKIFEKYHDEIIKYPDIVAFYYSAFGDCFRNNNSKKAVEYYRKSLKRKISAKVLLKMILAAVHYEF